MLDELMHKKGDRLYLDIRAVEKYTNEEFAGRVRFHVALSQPASLAKFAKDGRIRFTYLLIGKRWHAFIYDASKLKPEYWYGVGATKTTRVEDVKWKMIVGYRVTDEQCYHHTLGDRRRTRGKLCDECSQADEQS